jgi:hypothetical protein
LNDKKNKKEKKLTIHTTISEKANEILKKYANIKDDSGLKIFGNKSKVIERALELLDQYYFPEKSDLQTIWNRARNELNMVLVGKKTYLSYISGDYKKAFTENIAIDILEWYKNENIVDMLLNELLDAIKNVWLSANYFYKIDIEIGSKGTYQMSFYHDFHSRRYSEFWGSYFSELLTNLKNCEVEIFDRNESLILRITPPKT